jgi:60 kDa SS-A/Ro ribonucleoprotein
MANKNLFGSAGRGKKPRAAVDASGAVTRNAAGGVAFKFESKAALAQLACTGTFSNTYYTSAEDQLKQVVEHAQKVDSAFLGKLAVYARQSAFMKDTPAMLCAMLFARAGAGDEVARRTLQAVFPLACDNAKMVKNFVQIVRSGQMGRKSLGTFGKRLVAGWFESHNAHAIFRGTVGQSPSLVDVMKLAHPKSGTDKQKSALYDYLLEKKGWETNENLPPLVREFEAFKKDPKNATVPKVPFQMLTALDLGTAQWTEIALNGGWHFVRMNLNTFARHGVLKDKEVVKKLAAKLSDAEEIARAKAFPYQLFMAYTMTKDSADIPRPLIDALHDAMEIATKNVPAFDGEVWVFPDVSGSMGSPVTGNRGTATSKMTYVDVAALVAASILRTSRQAHVIPVDTQLHTNYRPEPRDSVMTNANKLRKFGGGGTNLSLALDHILKSGKKADVVLFISDNESWADRSYYTGYGFGQRQLTTGKEALWQQIRSRNPNAKLINIDISPNSTTQAADQAGSILNIGGFSDAVWPVIENFVKQKDAKFWVEEIEKIEFSAPPVMKVAAEEEATAE